MGWYRRSKVAFDAFNSFASKIIPKNPIRNSTPTINQHSSSIPSSNKSGVSWFGLCSPITRNLGFEFVPKQNHYSPFLGGARRYYYVDCYRLRPRGPRRCYKNPATLLVVVLVGSGVYVTVYYGHLETIPYTKRKHFVLLPKDLERKIGEAQLQQMKQAFNGKILPPIHPESVRVRLIARDIIEALQRGLMREQLWSDLGYASEIAGTDETGGGIDTLLALRESLEAKWYKEDEILDDKWVQESRKKGLERGDRPDIEHLEGLKWEVLVVDDPVVNAFCLPGGKIVVFTGLLDHFRTDPEIATIIGHEVGHVVARHAAEALTKNLWFIIVQLILFQFIMPDLVYTMSTLLLKLPFSRRMETEADYIGVLLMASAGYDPRVAPKVYEKLGKITGDSALRDYLSTHPSGKKRAQLLSQSQVMVEAMALYREAIEGRGVLGFL